MTLKQLFSILAAPLCLSIAGGCDNTVGNTVSNPVGPGVTFEKKLPQASSKEPRVTICHVTDSGAYKQVTINGNALSAHLDHGDALPGTGGLDENCQEVQVPEVPEDLCPCFDGDALAALNITFGGSTYGYSGYDNGFYTAVNGLGGRFTMAGQSTPSAPYACHIYDGMAGIRVRLEGITETEAETCRQLIKEEWAYLF